METVMETKEHIDKIIEEQYNNYRGRVMYRLKIIHNVLRKEIGDKKFLAYIIKRQQENPKPKIILLLEPNKLNKL